MRTAARGKSPSEIKLLFYFFEHSVFHGCVPGTPPPSPAALLVCLSPSRSVWRLLLDPDSAQRRRPRLQPRQSLLQRHRVCARPHRRGPPRVAAAAERVRGRRRVLLRLRWRGRSLCLDPANCARPTGVLFLREIIISPSNHRYSVFELFEDNAA